MSILYVFRTHRNEKYASINLTVIDDKNISWGAKGLHTYLISRPPEWKVFFNELISRSKDGKNAIRSQMRELNQHGYLDWKQAIDPVTKRYVSVQYDVYEIPNETAIENFKKRELEKSSKRLSQEKTESEPLTDFPQAEKTESGKSVSGSPVSGKEASSNNHISKDHISINQKEKIIKEFGQPIAPDGASLEKISKNKKQPTDHQLLTEAIAEVCSKNLNIIQHAKQCGKSAAAIKKAGATPEVVREKFGENGWWYKCDFRGKQGACPSPHVIVDLWGIWEKQTETKTNGVTNGKSSSYAEGQRRAAERLQENRKKLEAWGLA